MRPWKALRRSEPDPVRSSGPVAAVEGTYAALVATIGAKARTEEFTRALAASEAALAAAPRPDAGTGPAVSVVMPTRNRAEIVHSAISSVLEQTYPRWDLLVVDDGGEDDTERVVAAFDEPRVQYLRVPHGGAARARNTALARSRGEVVAYLDSDNVWHPDFLAVTVGRLASDPLLQAVYCKYLDVEVLPNRLRPKKWSPLPFDYDRLADRNFIDLNTFVHRRWLVERLGGFNPDLTRQQDWDLVLRYTFIQDPEYLDVFGVLYRRNPAWAQITEVHKHDPRPTEIIRAAVTRYYDEGPEVRGGAGPPRARILAAADGEGSARAADLRAVAGAEAPISVHLLGEAAVRAVASGAGVTDAATTQAEVAAAEVNIAVEPVLSGLGMALLDNARSGRPFLLDVDPVRWRLGPDPLALSEIDPGDARLENPQWEGWEAVLRGLVPRVSTSIQPDAHRVLFSGLGHRALAGPGHRIHLVRGVLAVAHVQAAVGLRAVTRTNLCFAESDTVIGWIGPVDPADAELSRLVTVVDARHRLLVIDSAADAELLAHVAAADLILVPPVRRGGSLRRLRAGLAAALGVGVPVVAAPDLLGPAPDRFPAHVVEPWDALNVLMGVGSFLRVPGADVPMVDRGRRAFLRHLAHRSARPALHEAISAAAAAPGPVAAAEEFAAFVARTGLCRSSS